MKKINHEVSVLSSQNNILLPYLMSEYGRIFTILPWPILITDAFYICKFASKRGSWNATGIFSDPLVRFKETLIGNAYELYDYDRDKLTSDMALFFEPMNFYMYWDRDERYVGIGGSGTTEEVLGYPDDIARHHFLEAMQAQLDHDELHGLASVVFANA